MMESVYVGSVERFHISCSKAEVRNRGGLFLILSDAFYVICTV